MMLRASSVGAMMSYYARAMIATYHTTRYAAMKAMRIANAR